PPPSPVRVFRVARCPPRASAPVVEPFELVISAICLFLQYRLEAGDIPANQSESKRILEGLGRPAELQTKLLLLEVANPRRDVILRHFANLFSSHRCAPPRGPRTLFSPASWPRPAPSP